MRRPRIAFVVASDLAARAFLVGHLRALSARYTVALVANTDDPDLLEHLGVVGATYRVEIERQIAPLRDLKALVALVRLFRRGRFDAVHSVTPKAGLLAMTAARIAGVPHRTHTFTGQVWATRSGPSRVVFRVLDQLTHRFSTFSLADSPSQREFLIRERVLRPNRSGVLAEGSISGVDTERYRADPDARRSVRGAWDIGEEDVLFLQLTRLTRDKGVLDLCRAFARVHATTPRARLAFVGPDEDGLEPEMRAILGPALAATRIEARFTDVPERYVAAADVLCLPSYREGFGSILIAAASAGVPAIASRIYGVTDAVVDGETGLLHAPGAVEEIEKHMTDLSADPGLRSRLGAAARARAHAAFSEERVTAAFVGYYDDILEPPIRYSSESR